jgi:hypothetical protein
MQYCKHTIDVQHSLGQCAHCRRKAFVEFSLHTIATVAELCAVQKLGEVKNILSQQQGCDPLGALHKLALEVKRWQQ